MKPWILVALVLLLPDQTYPQSSIRETSVATPIQTASPAPIKALLLDVHGTTLKIVKLKYACAHDDDVNCLQVLRVLFVPEDSLFGGSFAHLQLVYADTREPVKMLPPKESRTFHWKVTLRRESPHYVIAWDRAHPPLKNVTHRLYRIVVEGSDEIETMPFKFILPKKN